MPFSPLGLLDAIVPKDWGSRRIARDLAYGPHARHRLDLYTPRRPRGQLPLLVFVYGGGWETGDKSEYAFAGRAFAALGYLTAVVDYRVVPEVRFPAFVEDVARATDWLVAHAVAHGGDPLVLAGHSAGAYNAMMDPRAPSRSTS
jgi:acetyl esterase/lipase